MVALWRMLPAAAVLQSAKTLAARGQPASAPFLLSVKWHLEEFPERFQPGVSTPMHFPAPHRHSAPKLGLLQEGQALVKALMMLGSRPNMVMLRPSIVRWMATLDPAIIAATLRICADLQLSIDDSTVALILRDTAAALSVRLRLPASLHAAASGTSPFVCMQGSNEAGAVQVVTALRHLHQHAAEPTSELAYAQARPLVPVLDAACRRLLQLFAMPEQQAQVRPMDLQTALLV